MRVTDGRTISLVMIVKNEERDLKRSLASVKHIVDEMIVVDTGSTDKTVEIATEMGAVVLHAQWSDDFSAARNLGLDAASGDWILAIDADEELASTRKEIRSLTKASEYDVYLVDIVTVESIDELDRARSGENLSSLRFFRHRDDLRYSGRIHEHIPFRDGKRVGRASATIIHFGPTLDSPQEHEDRRTRNLEMLHQTLQEDRENGYLWAMLGHELFLRDDFEAAYVAYLNSSENTKDSDQLYIAPMLRNLCFCYFEIGYEREALEFVRDLESRFPGYTDLHFLEAEFLQKMGHLKDAVDVYQRCLNMGEPGPRFMTIGDTAGWRSKSAITDIKKKVVGLRHSVQ